MFEQWLLQHGFGEYASTFVTLGVSAGEVMKMPISQLRSITGNFTVAEVLREALKAESPTIPGE